MATLAYIVLCHGDPKPIISLARLLHAADDTGHVVVHYDAGSPAADFETLREAFDGSAKIHLVPDRIACCWGDFSLVDSVVRALRLIRRERLSCDRVCLLSGSCLPVRPIAHLKRYLDENPTVEFIEAEGPGWIVGGLREDRYRYRHWFSEIKHRHLFNFCVWWQSVLPFRRRFPSGLEPRFGSQWWCLTADTCWGILDYIDAHPAHYRFFKTTYIPDEMFFQSLVLKLVKPGRIFGKPLTYYEFSHQGKATILYDDSLEVVRQLPHFFARKISPRAERLRRHSAAIAVAADDGRPLSFGRQLPPGVSFQDRKVRQVEAARPGQIFYGNQLSHQGWPGVLGSSTKSFGVLYGPPQITGMVAEHLRKVPGLSLFGRIFRPDEVDFGPGGRVFEGLTTADRHIRDRDKPLYLARLLDRAAGFPVIQMSPGDDRDTEGALWYFPETIVLPCIPLAVEDEEWRRLYWAMAALAHPAGSPAGPTGRAAETISHLFLRRTIDRHIEKFTVREHRDWLSERIFLRQDDRHPLRLYFGVDYGEGTLADRHREQRQRFRPILNTLGPSVLPLLRATESINLRLCALAPEDVLAALPGAWKTYFRVLLEPLVVPNPPPMRRRAAVVRELGAVAED